MKSRSCRPLLSRRVYLIKLFEHLGIAAKLKAQTCQVKGEPVGAVVARGEGADYCKFITAPAAAPVIRKTGMDPV